MDKRTELFEEYYQEGNTVRTRVVERPLPDEDLLRLPPEQEQPSRASRAQRVPRFDPAKIGTFVLLTALSVLLAFGGIVYLRLNASVMASRTHIAEMEKELATLKMNNELQTDKLNAEIDLAEIYQVATVQLGMVHGDGSETITYEEQLREYVRQYENIPGR
ncbi:MAG: hypothetical protein J5493_00570 [Lachnospiraceae bacterium]|nr:hypothetical protein [Lachnospiraceae bacterium]